MIGYRFPPNFNHENEFLFYVQMHQEAMNIRKEIYASEAKTNEKVTRSLRALGRVHCSMDKSREGVGFLDKALTGLRSLYGPGVVRLEIAYAMDELGQAYAIMGTFPHIHISSKPPIQCFSIFDTL